MIRILIVDDHAFVRSGVCGVLRACEGIEVVGECCDDGHLPRVVALARPDVVLMDIRMPARSGMVVTRELLAARPDLRVLMLTGALSGRWLIEAAEAGAVGYLLKGDDPAALVEAVRAVAAGGTAWPAVGLAWA